jgi:hypothetical protein
LRRYVSEIKRLIDGASLMQWKKERPYDLMNSFLAEVDRDGAPWDRFADLVVGLAYLGGEAAKDLKPARELVDSIARLLGRSREIEDSAPKLPGPPKRIPPPKERDTPDDEIPFWVLRTATLCDLRPPVLRSSPPDALDSQRRVAGFFADISRLECCEPSS